MKEYTKEVTMQKCICIPVEQYELMLEAYDKVIEELAAMKKNRFFGRSQVQEVAA